MTVVVTTYSGALVSFYVLPDIPNPLNTIEDLMEKKGTITWGTMGSTALTDYMNTIYQVFYLLNLRKSKKIRIISKKSILK